MRNTETTPLRDTVMTTFRVAHVHPSLGFGGTQKSIETMVRYATERFEPHVLCLDDLGVRGESLRDDGYRAALVADIDGVRVYIREYDIAIFYVHGGYSRVITCSHTATEL